MQGGIRMKRRASASRASLKKSQKGHTPQKATQQTLISFFKQNTSDGHAGKKRFANTIDNFSKVIVIDEDCESDTNISRKHTDNNKKVCYNATEIQEGDSLDILSDKTLNISADLPPQEDTTDHTLASTSTPCTPSYPAVNCDVNCQRELFSSAGLSPVAEAAGPEDTLMSNLSELFDDLDSALVYKQQVEVELNVPPGVYKYTVSHFETVKRTYVEANKVSLKSIDTPARDALCFLMEDWYNTEIAVNSRINIILSDAQKYPFNPVANSLTICLDTTSTGVFLITHPDTLLSGTVVAGSFFCERKTVLNELIRSQETELAKHALTGTILHDIFQQAMLANKFDMGSLEQASRSIPTNISYMESLALLDMSAADVLENVNRHLPHFSQFGDRFMKQQPAFPSGKIDIPWKGDAASSESSIAVTEVLDIEESIWSPSYGLKGKIDASIAVKIRNRSCDKKDSTQELRIPFELKSGKMAYAKGSIEHRAQVMLYILMMGERLREEIPLGLLFYSQTGHLQGITANYQELKGILLRRNELASYLYSISSTASPKFPPLLREPRICSKCSQLNACMLIHQNVENGSEVSSGIGNEFSKTVGQLTESEKLYFSHWFNMIQLESRMQCNDNKVSEIWTKSSQERESMGNCYGHLIIESVCTSLQQGNESTLIRNPSINGQSELRDSNVSIGDILIVSYEDLSLLCIAWGTVSHLSSSQIVVSTGSVDMSRHRIYKSGQFIELRLDKCEYYRPSAIVLMNLVMFFQQNERSAKLRQLIIHRSPPSYTTHNPVAPGKLGLYSHLNSEQRHTIESILASSDYSLVQGMPGTGKTTLISCLIHVLISQQQTVLLSSFTNTALDNILIKLVEIGVDFVRIGKESSVHPSIVRFLPQTCLQETKTIKGVADFYNNKKLYAATCLSINNVFIQKTDFDWCIVDEASQLTQFLCLGPILRAKRFLLVGDIHQLPPLVRSSEAKKQGYDVSLFRKLSEDHPHSVQTLTSQYRMNASIMSIVNQLIYQQRMQCAQAEVSEGKLVVPNWDRGVSVEKWTMDCINPDKPVVFINTDQLESREIEMNQRVCNQFEVKIIHQISEALTKLGVPSSQIGIITPYRQQVNLLCSVINHSMVEPIEISTVDKFQGRDKHCIIVSAVRSNAEGKIGELLPDIHRLNVMITRARQKLIIVGSVQTLSNCRILNQLIEFFKERQWVVDLSKEQVSLK